MEQSDFDPFFFQTLLKSVKSDTSLRKIPTDKVTQYKAVIKRLGRRARNKLVLLVLQYYIYNENNHDTTKLDENSLPYQGVQTLDTGVSFNWNKFDILLQHLIGRFIRAAVTDEPNDKD